MEPHTRLVVQLFSVASEMKGFHSLRRGTFTMFHVAIYIRTITATTKNRSWNSCKNGRRNIDLSGLLMLPWHLMNCTHRLNDAFWTRLQSSYLVVHPIPFGSIQIIRFWDHPTVRAIQTTFEMFPLTVDGLRSGVKRLLRPIPNGDFIMFLSLQSIMGGAT